MYASFGALARLFSSVRLRACVVPPMHAYHICYLWCACAPFFFGALARLSGLVCVFMINIARSGDLAVINVLSKAEAEARAAASSGGEGAASSSRGGSAE